MKNLKLISNLARNTTVIRVIGWFLILISTCYFFILIISGTYLPKAVVKFQDLALSEDDNNLFFRAKDPSLRSYKIDLDTWNISKIEKIPNTLRPKTIYCPDFKYFPDGEISIQLFTSDCELGIFIIRDEESTFFEWLHSEQLKIILDDGTEMQTLDAEQLQGKFLYLGIGKYITPVLFLVGLALLIVPASNRKEKFILAFLFLFLAYVLFACCYIYLWAPSL